jgi:predicted glutamine amidotransferase
MCRLFAAISTEDLFAPWFLHKAPQSLLTQSQADSKRLQGDGWGVGWFENEKPRIRKSPKPLYRDRRLLLDVARKAKGQTLIGHVRWASNPMKLPKKEILGMEHTQPFVHQQWIFAHNGTLYIPREVRAALGPWEKYIQGNNDSEVLFYWLLKHLQGNETRVAEALRESLRGLDEIWRECRQKYPLYKFPYHGLNCVLSDEKSLIAFSLVDPNGFGKSKGVCSKNQPYYQLQWFETPNMFAVASEPLDARQKWRPFTHGELWIVSRQGKQLVKKSAPLI